MLAIAPACELDVERGPDWLLVRVRNVDLLELDASDFVERLWSLLEQHFTYRLVLELDEIEVPNSYLIGQLVHLYKRIQEHDGALRLCGLSPYNRGVVDTCRLSDCLCCYESPEEAVMGGWHPGQPR